MAGSSVIQINTRAGKLISQRFLMFFAYIKKLLGRTEARTRDMMYCQTIRTVRYISRDDRARIATCRLLTQTDRQIQGELWYRLCYPRHIIEFYIACFEKFPHEKGAGFPLFNPTLLCSGKMQSDVPRRLALSNFEHLVSLSSEHRTHRTHRQTDRQLKTLYGSLSKL